MRYCLISLGGYSDAREQCDACKELKNQQDYSTAVEDYYSGELKTAYEEFDALGNYSDSADYAEQILAQEPQLALLNAKVGDTFTYGTYEQDNDKSDGTEAISWRILKIEDNRVLVISELVLFSSLYDEDNSTYVKWSNCDLRGYLNSTFIRAAFTSTEVAAIMKTTVENEDDSTTEDSLFLLNSSEAEYYFASDDDRVTTWSDYANAQGQVPGGNPGWRLRGNSEMALVSCVEPMVAYDGGISRQSVTDTIGGIRPAMWISLS